MGTLENSLRSELRRTKITKAILGTIAVAGILSVAAVAPNVIGVLGKTTLLKQRRYQIKSALSRMIRKGYATLEKTAKGTCVRLTEKGELAAALLGKGRLLPQKPKRWDGKWHLLIFDIPERRRSIRAKIRMTLITLGFIRLQDSVWVYPYDCEDLIVLLKADAKAGKDVLYVIADRIENDRSLRRHFALAER